MMTRNQALDLEIIRHIETIYLEPYELQTIAEIRNTQYQPENRLERII